MKHLKIIIYLFILCININLFAQKSHLESNFFKEIHALNFFKTDNKLFADLIPKKNIEVLENEFKQIEIKDSVKILSWLKDNFIFPNLDNSEFKSDLSLPIKTHLKKLWRSRLYKNDILVPSNPFNTLIPLPYPYIIPGGRFREVYYWDSYFTMLGLAEHDEWDIIESMIKNFAFLIDTFGFIPNGNRSYYLSRSQPPFFLLMVKLLAQKKENALNEYLPQILKEYAFFMRGEDVVKEGEAIEHVVKINHTVLNRYYDALSTPRPESFQKDVLLAEDLQSIEAKKELFAHLRAACESGWDFSSRWFENPQDIKTIQTLNIIPIDLNALLYMNEKTIGEIYKQQGNIEKSVYFSNKATQRKKILQSLCWNKALNTFVDYNWKTQRIQKFSTLASAFSLFAEIAEPKQAKYVAEDLEINYLKNAGYITTLQNTNQQWDAPNAWAPLQYIVYKGLVNYKLNVQANSGAKKFLKLVKHTYQKTGKMMEKYDAVNTHKKTGGGEYPNQDGFGWTNGTYIILDKLSNSKK